MVKDPVEGVAGSDPCKMLVHDKCLHCYSVESKHCSTGLLARGEPGAYRFFGPTSDLLNQNLQVGVWKSVFVKCFPGNSDAHLVWGLWSAWLGTQPTVSSQGRGTGRGLWDELTPPHPAARQTLSWVGQTGACGNAGKENGHFNTHQFFSRSLDFFLN